MTVGPFSKYVVTAVGGTTFAAGNPFLVTVQATDAAGNPVTSYSGPGTVSITTSPADPQSNLPLTATLGSSGFGFVLANLKTAGSYTISSTASTFSGTSGSVTVTPSDATYFTVAAPPAATITQWTFPTVTAAPDNNPAPTTGTGTASVLGMDNNYTFSSGNTITGSGTFTPGTVIAAGSTAAADILATPGDPNGFANTWRVRGPATNAGAGTGNGWNLAAPQYSQGAQFSTSTAGYSNIGFSFDWFSTTQGVKNLQAQYTIDGTNPTITGSSSAITTRGLAVTAFTPTATGFTVTFSKPIVPADLTLFGGTGASPVQNVTLVGTTNGPVNGSLVLDSTDTIATFKASAIYLSTFFSGSTVLPNDTWKATLVSGTGTGATANGFFDALGAPLDGGNNGGHANYTTTFTTANDGKMALSIPDFARGPDGASTIKVPNDSAKGIPVTLSNVPAASGVKDVVFTLSYNPTLFVPTAGGTGDSSGTGSTFVMGTSTSVDATHATVTFTWHNGTAQSGTVVLGDILANVPNSAANQYRGKEILGIVGSSITVNGAAFTGVWANGLHVNAYFGDVTGDGKITGLDVATASTDGDHGHAGRQPGEHRLPRGARGIRTGGGGATGEFGDAA